MRDEAKLVEKVLDGDESAFDILLHPYRKGILNMAYQICLNPEDARDISQDAVIKAYQYLNKFKKTKSFKNWVYKITVNATFDFLRKKNREQNLIKDKEQIYTYSNISAEKNYHNKEIRDRIEFCLQSLTSKEKKAARIKSHLNECPLCQEEYKKYKNSLVETKKWIQSETLEWEEKEWRNILNRALRNKNLKNNIFVPLFFKPVWTVALMLILAVGLSIFVANPSLIKTEKSAALTSDLKWEDSQKQVEFTLVSLEKDLKIKWIFNKYFQLEEEIK